MEEGEDEDETASLLALSSLKMLTENPQSTISFVHHPTIEPFARIEFLRPLTTHLS